MPAARPTSRQDIDVAAEHTRPEVLFTVLLNIVSWISPHTGAVAGEAQAPRLLRFGCGASVMETLALHPSRADPRALDRPGHGRDFPRRRPVGARKIRRRDLILREKCGEGGKETKNGRETLSQVSRRLQTFSGAVVNTPFSFSVVWSVVGATDPSPGRSFMQAENRMHRRHWKVAQDNSCRILTARAGYRDN